MIRVVVTGSECTGKTTLAEALATRYGAPCVAEFARRFVARKGTAPEPADVDAIARGQISAEQEAAAAEPRLLIQDTDLLSTVVYARHYYGVCPDWIEEALGSRKPDLYLLADIDVPWVPDGAQRDRGDRREEMQQLFRAALLARELPFVQIAGSPEDRLRASVAAIDDLVAG